MKHEISKDNPREIALKILYEIDKNKAYSNMSLKKHLKNTSLKTVDRAFVTQLVYGVVKNKSRLDWIINKYSTTPIRKMSYWVLNILRLGIYQIIFLNRIPDSAAVNESVKLARKYGHKKISGFINAILRNVTRANAEDLIPSSKDEIEYISTYYSHPKWLIEKWIKDYGKEFTIELAKKNNENPGVTIRTNTLKTSRTKLIELLEQEGMKVEKGEWCPEAILIKHTSNIEESQSFKNGLFQIQDQSSMLVAHIIDPKEEQLILDLCAAPGGKTTHISQIMKDTGEIIARDIHSHKLDLMKKNNIRLGISNIQLESFDALELDSNLIEKADRVLLDAPCSGLGIIRKKPDLKWNKQPGDIKDIISLQYKMLDNAARYVKKDGILVYSTCTINPDENFNIIKKFLKNNNEFKLVPINSVSSKMTKHEETQEGYLHLFPHIDDIDGFFICKLKRV